jgi:Holliday junction DNA helicase RuvA
MIAFIQGKIDSYGTDWIVVDHDGMGWLIAYPHTDQISLHQDIKVYTYLHYSENDISLYGFSSGDEKNLFLRLISVKGLGPKTAMNMLAKAGEKAIIDAVETGNVSLLKKMPGIGTKSASQIVLDLKGKLVAADTGTRNHEQEYPPAVRDAIEGLKNLGYKQGELTSAVNTMMQNPDLTTEEYLKMGLRSLMKQKLGG